MENEQTQEKFRAACYELVDLCAQIGFKHHMVAIEAAHTLGLYPSSGEFKDLMRCAVGNGLKEIEDSKELVRLYSGVNQLNDIKTRMFRGDGTALQELCKMANGNDFLCAEANFSRHDL